MILIGKLLRFRCIFRAKIIRFQIFYSHFEVNLLFLCFQDQENKFYLMIVG